MSGGKLELGVFLAVDGPNGVGKSIAVRTAKELLQNRGRKVVHTAEPTETRLGRLAKELDGRFKSEVAYACLIAADRHEHAVDIRQWLETVDLVISDRYLPSSLVLNVARGVEHAFILALHSGILQPDLTILLTADPSVLAKRFHGRSTPMAVGESLTTRADEGTRYAELGPRLSALGIPTQIIDTTSMSSSEVGEMIAEIGEALLP